MENLPEELILHITSFFENPLDIVKLQYVCRRFLAITRDASLWRNQCFEHSSFLENLRRRRELAVAPLQEPDLLQSIQRVLANENGTNESGSNEHAAPATPVHTSNLRSRANERMRIMANWDPGYEHENVDYYSEYIQRHGPISVGWLQQPRSRESMKQEILESRGMALYHPPGNDEETHVIAPLDDGSVCIWDISAKSKSKGRIIGRSRAGVLSVEGDGQRSKMVSTGVTECISVDSTQNKLYVAVQSSLIELDLETLQVVAQEQFPFSISALSTAKHPTPLTIGTNLSLHLHDSRATLGIGRTSSALDDRVDPAGDCGSGTRLRHFRQIFSQEPSPIYASLFHPGPLSILHMPTSAGNWDGNGDIYVAGRFPSILNYDRRYFPKLRGTIHSGARLCSMASLPCPFSALNRELMRRSELTLQQVQASKDTPGSTLVACGEYNSKGSLELYGLSPRPELTTISSDSGAGSRTHNSTLKNRQTSSSSKLLSVSNHGTRIAFSDGGGSIKWVERDGVTEVRRWNINSDKEETHRSIFGYSSNDSGSGDIALKILNTKAPGVSQTVNTDNLVLWTGDKLGLLGFSSKDGFTSESFEESAKTAEEARKEREERIYGETMRRALVVQADEVRFMRGLGLGLRGGE